MVADRRLSSLNENFSKGLNSYTYLSFEGEELKISSKTSLLNVFNQTNDKITAITQNLLQEEHDRLNLTEDITQLKLLKKYGEIVYKDKYCARSKLWKRKIYEWLESIPFFNRFFPANVRVRADATFQAFNQYDQSIEKQIRLLQEKIQWIQEVDSSLKALNENQYASQQAFLDSLSQLQITVRSFPSASEILKSHFKLENSLIDILMDGQSFQVALNNLDDEAIANIFASTSWEKHTSLFTYPHKSFSARRMQKELIVVNQRTLENFKGILDLSLNQITLFEEFLTLNLDNRLNCHPEKVNVEVKNNKLTSNEIQSLITISQRVPRISLKGIEELDLSDLDITRQDIGTIVQQVIQMLQPDNTCAVHLPDLKTIRLPKADKPYLDAKLASQLLAIHSTLDLMKELQSVCVNPNQIQLPAKISYAPLVEGSLDLSGFPTPWIEYCLAQMPLLAKLVINHTDITATNIKTWLDKGWLQGLHTLELTRCQKLTTDVLFSVCNEAQMPHLWNLSLDATLAKGQRSLNDLPILDNPFKIARFYCPLNVVSLFARKLYNGPSNWAAIFQVPMARASVHQVFAKQDKVLDPQTVAYWLYLGDFQLLKAEYSVETILADGCDLLNDDNLVPFISKFPNLKSLSLAHCPHVTETGIERLAKHLNQTKHQLVELDLSSCPSISCGILFNDDNTKLFKRLNKLMMADQLEEVGIENIPESLRRILCYSVQTVRIAPDQLKSQCLDKILQRYDLSKAVTLDLTGCSTLTDLDLAALLDRLNEPDNSRRKLKIAKLNLTGCSNISSQIFIHKEQNGKLERKFLGTLSQMIIKDTKMDLQHTICQSYSNLAFHMDDVPLVNASVNLLSSQCTVSPSVHDHIVMELFGNDRQAQWQEDKQIQTAINPYAPEYTDFELIFSTSENSDPSKLKVHRNILSSQATYFRKLFKPGQELFNCSSSTLINQNASAPASQVLIDLLYGKEIPARLGWKTAAEAAELVSSNCLGLNSNLSQVLIDYVKSQFDLTNAQDVLASLVALKADISFCLPILKGYLETDPNFVFQIAPIATAYNLRAIQDQLTQIALMQAANEGFIQ